MTPYYEIRAGTYGRVGFYGCAAARGRLVRVALHPDLPRAPQRARVLCPACELEHDVAPTWRKATDADAGREPEIVIGPDTPTAG